VCEWDPFLALYTFCFASRNNTCWGETSRSCSLLNFMYLGLDTFTALRYAIPSEWCPFYEHSLVGRRLFRTTQSTDRNNFRSENKKHVPRLFPRGQVSLPSQHFRMRIGSSYTRSIIKYSSIYTYTQTNFFIPCACITNYLYRTESSSRSC
jgi:hypothetical protein